MGDRRTSLEQPLGETIALERPRLSVRQRLVLLWGKVRRFGLAVFRPGYVRRSIARRSGECLRCGACCRLGFRCVLLRQNGLMTECRVHDLRLPNCPLFPIDERDLADRDLIMPERPCGYSFAPDHQDEKKESSACRSSQHQ